MSRTMANRSVSFTIYLTQPFDDPRCPSSRKTLLREMIMDSRRLKYKMYEHHPTHHTSLLPRSQTKPQTHNNINPAPPISMTPESPTLTELQSQRTAETARYDALQRSLNIALAMHDSASAHISVVQQESQTQRTHILNCRECFHTTSRMVEELTSLHETLEVYLLGLRKEMGECKLEVSGWAMLLCL